MTLDARTPCPACSIQSRALFESAQVTVALADLHGYTGEHIEQLRISVAHFAPYVEAHLENQDHAMSIELMPYRNPHMARAPVLVLDRSLPFGEG